MATKLASVNGPISSAADNVDPDKCKLYDDTNVRPDEQQPFYPILVPRLQAIQPYTYSHAEAGIEQKQAMKGDDEQILLEPEGVPSAQTPVARPSYIPPINGKSIDDICQSLNASIGLFKSKRTKIKAFQSMLESTTKQDRSMIRMQYRAKYNTSISRVVQRNFSGSFRQLLLFAFLSDDQLYVNEIEYALSNNNTHQLIAVLCTLDNERLRNVESTFNQSMQHKQSKTLKQWTDCMTSCMFYRRNINKVLLNILNGTRSDDGNVDMQHVEMDAHGLHHQLKHATKQNLNKQVLIKLFTHRSFEHLYYISLKYEQLYRERLVDVLKPLFRKTSEIGYAILLILQFAISKYDVFSTFLGRYVHNSEHDQYCSFLRFVMLHYDADLNTIINHYGRSALDSWIKLELRNNGHPDTARSVMKLCGFL